MAGDTNTKMLKMLKNSYNHIEYTQNTLRIPAFLIIDPRQMPIGCEYGEGGGECLKCLVAGGAIVGRPIARP